MGSRCAPSNLAWQEFFNVLERASAKQPAGTWPVGASGSKRSSPSPLSPLSSPSSPPSPNVLPPFSLPYRRLCGLSKRHRSRPRSSSQQHHHPFLRQPPNITRTFSNLSAPLSLDALSPEGKAALRDVLLLHVTDAYHLEAQLEEMASPNASNPAPQHGHVYTTCATAWARAPQHGHIYSVNTNLTIQIHIESDKSLVFRVPANANTPVRDSPYTAYSVTAAATVLPALKDAVADGRISVQGADHVLLPPTGPANAVGRGRQGVGCGTVGARRDSGLRGLVCKASGIGIGSGSGGDSPYTAYSDTAAATVLPALTDAVADGRLAVQGADHVLVLPTGEER
ncbi:unnamed protein product [Closterium sp. Naga37s-1]|nr:unnamed protein product [Closterium sp. Naga37s-1]